MFLFISRMVTRLTAVCYAQVHYLSDPAVDEIIVMDHGKIVARGRQVMTIISFICVDFPAD